MGEVWLADHLTLDTQVAVKFINEVVATDVPASLDRFQREASAAAKIKSPHVVQTFDQGVMEDGTPYIVMELLNGESLGDRLDRVGRLSIRQTAMVVSQVSKALRAAHRVGIIHRDIKPENIYLIPFEDGKLIKVLDFGIAKQTRMPESRRLTQDGLLIGTPEYMCRDQIVKLGAVDFRSDLWALTVVAYECLTGKLPFDGPTLGMVCANIINGKYTPATAIRDDLPPDVDAWFERALHAEPEQRFEGAKDMAATFLRLLPTRISDIEADLFDSDGGGFSIAPGAYPSMASLGQPGLGTKVGAPAPALMPKPAPRPPPPPGLSAEPPDSSRTTLPSVGERRRQTLAGSSSELRVPETPRARRSRALFGGLLAAAVVGGLATYLMVRPASGDRSASQDRGAAAVQPSTTPTAAALAVRLTGKVGEAKSAAAQPPPAPAAQPKDTSSAATNKGAGAPGTAASRSSAAPSTAPPAVTTSKPRTKTPKPPAVKTPAPVATSPETLGF